MGVLGCEPEHATVAAYFGRHTQNQLRKDVVVAVTNQTCYFFCGAA
jgi:hypothetical protein